MATVYIKPRPRDPKKPSAGVLQVRGEDGQVLPAEGRQVALTPYWRRRLRDGDVVKASPPKRKAQTETKEE